MTTPEQLWAEFLASATPEAREAEGAAYTSWHFGTGGTMADELLGLVLAGPKRATAGDLWSYELEGEPLPKSGDYSVVTDGSGSARAIIRTTSVEVVPFSEVTAEFAAAEGEGDLSLGYWREGHWHYFSLTLAEVGRKPELDMPVVCERFDLVWPSGRAR